MKLRIANPMATDTRKQIDALLPQAILWATRESNRVQVEGELLSPEWMSIARQVGVKYPERIRLALPERIPVPDASGLRQACDALQLIGPNTVGLTLGYSILIQRGSLTRQVIAHECRHVRQFEKAGSLEIFLTRYLGEIVEHGYQLAPMEVDARSYQVVLGGPDWFVKRTPIPPFPLTNQQVEEELLKLDIFHRFEGDEAFLRKLWAETLSDSYSETQWDELSDIWFRES